jgi:hypothetical protein
MIRDDGSSVDEETENRVKWIATSGFGGMCPRSTAYLYSLTVCSVLAGLDTVYLST